MTVKSRVEKFRADLKKSNVDAYFVTDILNIAYLTGFTGSTAYLIISRDSQIFFTDGRYEKQSSIELDNSFFDIQIVSQYSSVISDEFKKYKSVMVEPSIEVSLYFNIVSKNTGIKIIHDEDNILLTNRMIKDSGEVEMIKTQYEIAAKSFLSSLSSFKSGVSERSWAALLAFHMLNNGADGESFDTIVASGVRGALPHGRASDKIIETTDSVIVDFGCKQQYNSDYTRMIYSGNDSEILSVINIVRDAMLKSIDFCKAGVKSSDVNNVAMQYISSKGYGKYFNHSLGHGVGLNIHELPNINSRSDVTLSEGMIFTIEPGIYLPDRFGVRIEESVHIKSDGIEVISSYLKEHVYKMA